MNTEEIKELTHKVNEYIHSFLSPPRYAHSLRVAALARELCLRFELDPETGYFAGLAHDMCKAGRDRWVLSLASKDLSPISEIESKKPALMHGRAASVFLAQDFGVTDISILSAIRNHTFGAPDMDALGKIIFIADKLEPGRKGFDPEKRKKMLASELNSMARMVLEDNIRYLESRGKEVSAITYEMLGNLKGRKKDT